MAYTVWDNLPQEAKDAILASPNGQEIMEQLKQIIIHLPTKKGTEK